MLSEEEPINLALEIIVQAWNEAFAEAVEYYNKRLDDLENTDEPVAVMTRAFELGRAAALRELGSKVMSKLNGTE